MTMKTLLAIALVIVIAIYFGLRVLLHGTQSKREPHILETAVPFLGPAVGIFFQRGEYLANLKKKYRISIHTLRLPFQRLYVVHAPQFIHGIQNKANAATYVPNLLEFGMLFSGLNWDSKRKLKTAYQSKGNGFTASVHKYLLSGPSLRAATVAAIDRLSASLPNGFRNSHQGGLLDLVRHELTLAMSGSIYGPENPYEDPDIEESWRDFVPGISHLLYSPFPRVTARKALCARKRVIDAFRRYFETGGHLQAFPMIPEMYEINKSHGLATEEAAKLEMATSLAMLSSGAITAFWLLFHVFSDADALRCIRDELQTISKNDSNDRNPDPKSRTLNLNSIKQQCPVLVAVLNETLRLHSTVINVKQVQSDTMLVGQYLLKKNGIVMIPGQSIHHDKDIWGASADVFDYERFLSSKSKQCLSSTSAFRPFGGGVTMCPGRHFSTNVILSMVAMIVLKYDILPVGGQWVAPTKRNADLWNAMPKPDWDLEVQLLQRIDEGNMKWKFVWCEV